MRVVRNLCLSILAAAMMATIAQGQVAINEIDYDNPSSDPGEFIELVGRAGTVLDGWTVRAINGNDGNVYGDYELQGTIPHDFDSAWGGQGGFFVIGNFDAETVHRANAINEANNSSSSYYMLADTNPNQGYGLDGLPNTADDGVWANTAPDWTPTNWPATHALQNGSFGDGPGDIVQLWDGTPGESNLVDEWYYDYDPGYAETGLSEGIDTYDSAGSSDGTGLGICSIGRYGYSYGTPLLVFDNENMDGLDLYDREPNDGESWTYTGASTFTADNYLGTYSFTVDPQGSFIENGSAKEVRWSGTDGNTETEPQGCTPGTFNNVDFGEGSQDIFTINIKSLESPVTIPGDTNGDNIVDDEDAEVLGGNWGQSVGNGADDGDFNGDGVVNALDASILAANWGNHNESAGPSSVPEPGSLMLLAMGLAMLVTRRTTKS